MSHSCPGVAVCAEIKPASDAVEAYERVRSVGPMPKHEKHNSPSDKCVEARNMRKKDLKLDSEYPDFLRLKEKFKILL